jgi:hypothetical protein
MLTLALVFKAHETARMEEVAGALIAVGGGLLIVGALAPLARRTSQIVSGIAFAVAGVLFVLAVRYGVRFR